MDHRNFLTNAGTSSPVAASSGILILSQSIPDDMPVTPHLRFFKQCTDETDFSIGGRFGIWVYPTIHPTKEYWQRDPRGSVMA